MKPAVLFTTLLLAAAALPASAQHSASGTIAPAPAAAAALSASAPAVAAASTAQSATMAPPAGGAVPALAGAGEPAAAAKAGSAMVLPATALPAAAQALPSASSSPSSPSSAGSLLQTTLALAFVLALLVGLAWLLKRYGPKSMGSSSAVRLVGSLSVGTRERILVVEVGEQWIVVGASPGRMNALATMPRQQQDEIAAHPQPGLAGANFAEWFKQTIEKRNGK
ncbi:flagellar biosynthetic protein FliO [Rugamonas sp. DEMB1]|uniref:flagellar biosynthetic protein FliO n=1 Tax=Rugamonas sp. DEMB1 TaxID=3039386 RepID=UPI0024481D69|nr:flagellar biosynthetic protein FliO [Rugamonas sp. DEMB1]WGG51677.1 flagellar biosynthetic protein FliO [Rugamonas sp. DEMB1]